MKNQVVIMAVCVCVTGETESDPHWVYCSKFLFCCLSHLLVCLGKLSPNNFGSQEEYQQIVNITNLLVRKAEMVYSSHSAYWWAPPLTPTHTHRKYCVSAAPHLSSCSVSALRLP